MLINTRAIGITMTDEIIRHVEARVEGALGFAARHLSRVTVRLTRTNPDSPRPGAHCRLVVTLRGHYGIRAFEAVDTDPESAVEAAAQQARRSLLADFKRFLASDGTLQPRPRAFAPA